MRAAVLLLAVLSSCASPGDAEGPEDPASILDLLARTDPLQREEGATRLEIQGGVLPDALDGRPQALAYEEQDLASLRPRIARALEESDPQRLLWRAYHALRGGCLAREWARVSEALSRQGFKFTEIYEPHDRSKFVRFLGQPSAYVNPAGDRHDLFFWVHSLRQGGAAWRVHEVYVGLNVRFDASFKQLSATDRYPRESVLGRFFDLPQIHKMAQVFPLLEEIDFTYGRIREAGVEAAAFGFHVNAGFAMDGKKGGRAIYYTAQSGLDPPERRRGRLDWSGFAPSDATGTLTPRGTGYWGAGGPPVQED
jgi:hypothetical protein